MPSTSAVPGFAARAVRSLRSVLSVPAVPTLALLACTSERDPLALLGSPDPADRERAVQDLLRTSERIDLGRLIDYFDNQDSGVRAAAASVVTGAVLAQHPNRAELAARRDAFVTALWNDSTAVRAAACAVLRELWLAEAPGLELERVAARLLELLRSAEPADRVQSAIAVAALGPRAPSDTVPALIANLSASDHETRATASDALARVAPGRNDVATALGGVLADVHASVRASAALSLGKQGAAAVSAAPRLRALLRDPDPAVRDAAARALGRIGAEPEAAISALLEQLDRLGGPSRDVWCVALGRLAERTADPAVHAELRERLRGAREAGVAARCALALLAAASGDRALARDLLPQLESDLRFSGSPDDEQMQERDFAVLEALVALCRRFDELDVDRAELRARLEDLAQAPLYWVHEPAVRILDRLR